MKTLFVDVILPLPLEQLFTYRVPQALNDQVKERVRVVVQFGRSKMYSGLVAKIHDQAPVDYQAKYIDQVLDEEPIIHDFQLKFWEWLAKYYMCSLGEAMNTALPSGFKLNSETVLHLHPAFEGDFRALNDKEYLVAEALENNDKLTLQEVGDILGQKTIMPLIKGLIEKRVAISAEDLKLRYKPKVVDFVKRYKAKYSVDQTSDIVAPVGTAHAYDLTHLLIKAVIKAGSSDSSAVRNALESLGPHQGLVKHYNPPFTSTRHDALDRGDFILTRYKNHYS